MERDIQVLSVDASLRSTGWAIIRNDEVIDVGRITTKKTADEDLDVTISNVVRQLLVIAGNYHLDFVAIEDGFVGKSNKTSLQLSGLRQSIITGIHLHGLKTKSLHPSRIRRLLMGKGQATKEEVALHILEHHKENRKVIALGAFCDRACKAKNSDMYDAIAIGLAAVIKHKED